MSEAVLMRFHLALFCYLCNIPTHNATPNNQKSAEQSIYRQKVAFAPDAGRLIAGRLGALLPLDFVVSYGFIGEMRPHLHQERILHLYCDESVSKGKYFSNFYGGVLVGGSCVAAISDALEQKKGDLGFHGECKWSKVTENYLDQYKELMSAFFGYVHSGEVKVRVMFTHNINEPELTDEDKESGFYKLYYQFLKNAFGFQYIPDVNATTRYLRLYLDELPDKRREKRVKFKKYLADFPRNIKVWGLMLQSSDIAEVDSRKHVLLQCADIIVGSMAFYLNNGHKVIPAGKRRRGKRTVAKEKLYKHIRQEICKTRPNFNVGENTGHEIFPHDRWNHPYRHWKMVPNNSVQNLDRGKHR